MSKRKREAIALAGKKAAAEAVIADQTPWGSFVRANKLAIIGCCVLLAVGALGATVTGLNTSSSGGNWFGSSSAAATSPSTAAVVTTGTPQLSKEYVYAGGRLLATEDAGAAANSNPTDLIVWRLNSGSGYWYVRDGQSTNTQTTIWGQTGDVPAPADYDGDGLSDFCIYRSDTTANTGTWHIQPNGGGYAAHTFGLPTDKPVPADYDGDGRADVAVWRNGTTPLYIILLSGTNSVWSQSFGSQNDTPVPADYDGDGKADLATFRPSNATWTIRASTNAATTTQTYGSASDEPVTGDFDGDGKFDLATRNGSQAWAVKQSSNATTVTTYWGASGDVAVPGDYDSDSKTDIAIWRPSSGVWYILQTSNSTMRVEQWGQSGDVPIAAPFKR